MNLLELYMKKIKILFLIITISSLIFPQSKVGTTAANFLSIPVGSRAAAMGGAFTAIANDATAAFWNPGGLSRLAKSEFDVSYSEWLVGTKINWFGLAFKISDDDAVALSINQLNYGQDDITTTDQPDGTGQKWDAADIAFALSYARNLTDRFSIGGSVKYISQRIWNESASAFAIDIGLLFMTQLDGLRIGMNISNFGTEMQLDGKDLLQAANIDPSHTGTNNEVASKLSTDAWPLPLNFAVGLGWDAISNDQFIWTIAADAIYPNNQTSFLNVGTEITWNKLISLRGGYNSLFKQSAIESFTAGFGVQYDFGGFFGKFDYGFSKLEVFGNISRFSLSVGL